MHLLKRIILLGLLAVLWTGQNPLQGSEFVDSWKVLADAKVDDLIRKDVKWIKRVNDWESGGLKVRADPDQQSLNLFKQGSSEKLAEVTSDGRLLPEVYDFPIAVSATPVGDVTNGYQLFKNGGDFSCRRVPDTSPYNPVELNDLTQHTNAHVLERHGHDVTDEALVKRAGRPSFAPDGKRANNPPDYSSKFESAERLKDALNNTKPGTPDFNPPSNNNTYVFSYPVDGPSSTPFGYGVPAGGDISSAVPMNSVLVVYKKQNGIWKLLTMYPQKLPD